jgi:hypothetical protein
MTRAGSSPDCSTSGTAAVILDETAYGRGSGATVKPGRVVFSVFDRQTPLDVERERAG